MPLDFDGQKDDTTAEIKRLHDHPLMNKTSAEIDAYIDANINDMAAVKQHLKVLTKAVAILFRKLLAP